MTSVIAWMSRDPGPGIWAVADSRITGDHGQPLVDIAPKLFELPIVVRIPGADGFFSQVSYQASVGFAYTGDAFVGLAVAELGRTVLGHLIHGQHGVVPSLHEVGLALGYIARSIFEPLRDRRAPGDFEGLLFGWCPCTNRLQIIRITEARGRSGVIECEVIDSDDPSQMLCVIGSDRDGVREAIEQFREAEDPGSLRWWRAPRFVLRGRILVDADPLVGGWISTVIANGPTTQSLVDVVPRVYGEPEAALWLGGLDVLNIVNNVGPCGVGLAGLA